MKVQQRFTLLKAYYGCARTNRYVSVYTSNLVKISIFSDSNRRNVYFLEQGNETISCERLLTALAGINLTKFLKWHFQKYCGFGSGN